MAKKGKKSSRKNKNSKNLKGVEYRAEKIIRKYKDPETGALVRVYAPERDAISRQKARVVGRAKQDYVGECGGFRGYNPISHDI